jgi:chloramphenicol 3-O-phosphotransferase
VIRHFNLRRTVAHPPERLVGRRVVVTGIARAGKSTFSRALSAKTGLPLVHLDVHFWKPGWVKPSDEEWREKQRGLLASDEWILDGNYHATLALRLEGADTVVLLDTPWWVCAKRAFVRGIRRRPVGSSYPTAATSRLYGGCAKNGCWPGLSGEFTDLSAN